MRETFYCSKKFLNLDGYESDASIWTKIEFWSEDSPSVDCSLKIRDCHHSISLIIGVEKEGGEGENFGNSLFKIDTLVEELKDFRIALIRAYEEANRRREESDKKNQDEEHQSDGGGGIPTPEG
jgi:hypothetical protein